MEKISSAQLAELMSEVGPTLRRLVHERDEAIFKLASIQMERDAEKVATVMINKGLTNEPYDQLFEQMFKAAQDGTLSRIWDAVQIAGPDMGEKLATLASDDVPQTPEGADFFTRTIME